jgi:peroxiredoxin
VGDAAPDVTATDESGNAVKLSSFKDKSGVIIFFFPKAFTGG